jgi:hypothetical protein
MAADSGLTIAVGDDEPSASYQTLFQAIMHEWICTTEQLNNAQLYQAYTAAACPGLSVGPVGVADAGHLHPVEGPLHGRKGTG